MKRYFKEVKLLDSGNMKIRDFIYIVFEENKVKLSDSVAAYKIYLEDGGTKYSKEDFMNVVDVEDMPRHIAENF